MISDTWIQQIAESRGIDPGQLRGVIFSSGDGSTVPDVQVGKDGVTSSGGRVDATPYSVAGVADALAWFKGQGASDQEAAQALGAGADYQRWADQPAPVGTTPEPQRSIDPRKRLLQMGKDWMTGKDVSGKSMAPPDKPNTQAAADFWTRVKNPAFIGVTFAVAVFFIFALFTLSMSELKGAVPEIV